MHSSIVRAVVWILVMELNTMSISPRMLASSPIPRRATCVTCCGTPLSVVVVAFLLITQGAGWDGQASVLSCKPSAIGSGLPSVAGWRDDVKYVAFLLNTCVEGNIREIAD